MSTHAKTPPIPPIVAADDRPVGSRVSEMADGMIGSAILKVAGEIRALLAEGRGVCNLTVGDFSPAEFPVPAGLARRVQDALRAGETNYPPSNGLPALRESVARFYREWLGLDYPAEAVLILAGARPAIYATFRVLVDPGDRVVFGVPSWNNGYYCQLTGALPVPIACDASTNFLPTRRILERAVRGARLLSLNSPLNPTGTAFDADALAGICDLVLEENDRRAPSERPLFLLYDQIYWMLTYGETRHVNPISLRPEIAPYTILVDGISKAFAATGLRVGWLVGPTDLVARMSDFNGHVGAWAPRPEQVATADFLAARDEIVAYHDAMKGGVQARLDALYHGLVRLRDQGLPVDAIPPAGAIYLSARFALNGRRTPDGRTLVTNEDVRSYLLHEAGFAVVPFQAFGVEEDSGWFRLSVGACSVPEIEAVLPRVEAAVRATTV